MGWIIIFRLVLTSNVLLIIPDFWEIQRSRFQGKCELILAHADVGVLLMHISIFIYTSLYIYIYVDSVIQLYVYRERDIGMGTYLAQYMLIIYIYIVTYRNV